MTAILSGARRVERENAEHTTSTLIGTVSS
jgi:hypothetical protein